MKRSFLLLAMLVMSWTTQVLAASASYTLSSDATTSAGVYDSDGVLIRTLWNNVPRSAGTHTADWNGVDDNGILRPNGSYEIRVLSNNVQYAWDGVIGNTSSSLTGPSRHHTLNVIYGMAVSGSAIYFATGYNEQGTASFKTSVGNPQQQTPILDKGRATSYFVAADETNVYWAASDAALAENSFVYVTRIADDMEASLPGAGVKVANGRTYTSARNIVAGAGSTITGLAVQKGEGKYLFVARRALNRIDVVDKATGVLVQMVTVTTPRALATDSGNNLFVARNGTRVSHYTVDPDTGALSLVGNLGSFFSKPLALAVSPDDTELYVADGGATQQVVSIDIGSHAYSWGLGESGGYVNGAEVNDDKFFFRQLIPQTLWDNDWTFLAVQPDGKFWVGDLGNYRYQRYDADRNFVDRIQYLPAFYTARVDQNDSTRVFANYLEFSVDYSKPLAPNNGSWTLVKNWGWTIVPTMNDQFSTLRSVTTLANGRTYALLGHRDPPINAMEVVELPPAGNVQLLGVQTPDMNYALAKDGSLRHVTSWIANGTPYTWAKRDVSFDASGNPTWGPLTTVATSPPKTAEDPSISGNSWSIHPWEATSTGILLAFAEYPAPGWHVQGLDIATGQWKWRSGRATNSDYTGPYPTDGSFDIGNTVNNYAGGGHHAVGRNIFWEYHGEFWKQDQANMWTHLYDDGLMVGLFGVASKTYRPYIVPDGTRGMAGNAFSSAVVTAPDGSLYIYQNDENRHGGIHRWHVTGLDTIHEDSFSVSLNNVLQTGLSATYYDAPQVRWDGFIKPRYTELYTFDTPARLWVNNQLVAGSIQLEAGKLYPITLEDYEGGASLSWSSASQEYEVVPSSQLFFVDTTAPTWGMNLLEGLRAESGVMDGAYSWHRDPANDITGDMTTDWWVVSTSRYTYQRDHAADISASFSRANANGSVVRDLLPASAGLSRSWSLDGMIAFGGEPNVNDYPSAPWGHGWYLDVLDDAGKIIARLNPRGGDGVATQQMEVNGQVLAAMNRDTWFSQYSDQPQRLQICADSSGIRFTWADKPRFTVPVFDATSDWRKPRKLRLLFWEKSLLRGHEVDLAHLTFSASP